MLQTPVLPNEVWVDILRHLSLETLWYSTRPVCSLFYHVSTSIVKSMLVDGSSCELRHYISYNKPLLSEWLHYPTEHTEYHQRILRQEGHSPFSQILVWSSTTPSPANPSHGPGIPTVNYESADGKKCVTMAVFGYEDRTAGRPFHCRRTGCVIAENESASDGHVCLAGCWHVHYSRVNRMFCVTIPLATLLPIYLRLESATRQRKIDTARALERKGRWSNMSRHGVSASVSPITPANEDGDSNGDDQVESSYSVEGGDDGQGPLTDWLFDEESSLSGLFDVYGGTGQMEFDG